MGRYLTDFDDDGSFCRIIVLLYISDALLFVLSMFGVVHLVNISIIIRSVVDSSRIIRTVTNMTRCCFHGSV